MPTTLYRPVGLDELALIGDARCREFPPRLLEQPIFYPVTSAGYRTQIARDWNTKASSFAGFVTSFNVDNDYLSNFERHVVGSAVHEEYWIPAEQLPSFNLAIRGPIAVDAAFFSDSFVGFVPDKCGLKGKNAEPQFVILAHNWDYNRMDFDLEISVKRKAGCLNCWFGLQRDFSNLDVTADLKSAVLAGVVEVWSHSRIDPGLPSAFSRTVLQG
jgi:hypothetical protein